MSTREFCLLAVVAAILLIWIWQQYGKRNEQDQAKQKPKPKPKRRLFRLRPKEPKDCPHCVDGVKLRQVNPAPAVVVVPYAERKKPGGPKKRINTDGYACPFAGCKYHGNRDASVHALVGAGKRGVTDSIQWFRCQACQTRFSARVDTPLRDLKTEPEWIELMLNFLAEGVDPA